ncbi:hypothetical protein GGP41_007719 [Bipolaris sorokiniana]|uniref:Uncharacterized protein n=1 Tax=Cochliobolus sativus TaxID=45130 RepID=A0A8H5ZKH8_COCSA|nr:hypothetical protein GGP41_007719 [Bipolaris sorokiniana]
MEKMDIKRHEMISEGSPYGVLVHGEDGRTRQLPIPSAHPDDPLNFSLWKQRPVFLTVCLYTISGFSVIQTAPLFFRKLISEYKQKTQRMHVVI